MVTVDPIVTPFPGNPCSAVWLSSLPALDTFNEWNPAVRGLLRLVSQHEVLRFSRVCSLYQYLTPFHGW